MHPRTRIRVLVNSRAGVRVIAVASFAVVLVGCTPAPTVLPDVIVEQTGSSPLDGDEWVIAVRATELAQTLAWNSGDFTIDSLRGSTSPSDVEALYEHYAAGARKNRAPHVYSGPVIWAPISVNAAGNSANLVVCVATQDRTINAEHPGTVYGLDTGIIWEWTYEKLPSGAIEQTGNHQTLDQCSAEMAEVLVFDPAPTLPEKINEGDIRAPAYSD